MDQELYIAHSPRTSLGTVPITTEVYDTCTSMNIFNKIILVASCNGSKCFIIVERLTANYIHSNNYHYRLMLLSWQVWNTAALVSSFKVLIRQAFVNPLTSRFLLRGSDWVVLLHSWWPMKFTMSTSPPLAMICVISRRPATSSLFPGVVCWPLDFSSYNDCFILNSRHRIMKCPEPKFLHIGHVLALHVVQLIYID